MTTSHATQDTRAYFDGAAQRYDQAFTNTVIGRAEREGVWREAERVFRSGDRILELNCGTGVDALRLAGSGVRVLACDIAPRMIEIARQRLNCGGLQELVEFRVLATEDIALLHGEGPFDGAFSNFSGLNCVEDLSAVARNLAGLLKPGAPVLLCMSGPFVPLEMAWYLAHGNARKAVRRLKPVGSGDDVRVHYPSPKTMARLFAPGFRFRQWSGIGVVLPPAYLESWARRFPRVLDWLARADGHLGRVPALRAMAGHIILHFERLGT
jgi:ubiquinone/menaquinone biosynthesis C-methylase UbiE